MVKETPLDCFYKNNGNQWRYSNRHGSENRSTGAASASTALRANQHPRLSLLFEILPGVIQAVARLAINLGLVLVSMIFIVYGYEFFTFDGIMRTPALRIRYYWVFAIIPVGGVLLLLHVLAAQVFPSRFTIMGGDDLPTEANR